MKLTGLLFVLAMISAQAQNTLTLPPDSDSPKATLADITWMEGHWKGTAFGGITEEIWSPPLGGSMMFSFKLVIDRAVKFYELGHIRELDGTLVFELKHFEGDLKGWEEKEEVQRFRLVKVDGNRLYFEGFTFEKASEDEINIYGLIHQNGEEEEMVFNYRKQ